MMHQTSILEDGQTVILIHYLYREGERLVIACTPGLREDEMCATAARPFPWHRSGEPEAVTCPVCKQSLQWQEMARHRGLLPHTIPPVPPIPVLPPATYLVQPPKPMESKPPMRKK